MKIEARNTAPTRIPVTPSITAIPDTSASSFQTWGEQGFAARRSSVRQGTQQWTSVFSMTWESSSAMSPRPARVSRSLTKLTRAFFERPGVSFE